jgi:hypothetical protein
MLNILTVYKTGGAFTRDYVIKLAKGVRKNLSKSHRFICLTDDLDKCEAVYDDENMIQWEPLIHNWPAWYSKAEIFRPDLNKYGRFLFIDLSSVIVGSLDEIASYASGVCVTEDFYHGGPSQSVLSYTPKALRHVWDRWIADPDHWMKKGNSMEPPHFRDQVLMSHLTDLDYWQNLYPGQVVSFKRDCEHGVPDNARIVKFHGRPKPHEVNKGWVKQVWGEGRDKISFVPESNTVDEISLEQMRVNCSKDIPWIKRVKKPNNIPIAMVGGGPSLKESLGAIRVLQMRGGHIWALNGTHDYLLDNNIVPNAMAMLDSRPGNIAFVQRPHSDVTYYVAARCHPSVLDALECQDVVLWHSVIDQDEDIKIIKDTDAVLIGGGSTVGLRSMYLAWVMLGYTEFHLFGYDSSYREETNHAYKQGMNKKDDATKMSIFVNDREFITNPWMANQVEGFKEQVEQMVPHGCEVNVYGDGMLPYVAKLMEQK